MSYENVLDLNIGQECLDNWNNHNAIRELIANGIDEHTTSKIKKPIVIRQNKNNYEIIDYGRGLTQDDFIHKTNKTKTSGTGYIGQFGIGLKDSLGVLCKNDIDIIIFTKQYKFEPEYIEKKGTSSYTLHINVSDNTEKDINYGTKIVLYGIDKKDIDNAKKYFIDYTTEKYDMLYESNQSNQSNQSIFKFDKKQLIFVNGMRTCETSELYFSYNIKKSKELQKHFDRDRGDKDYKIFKKYIQGILEKMEIFNDDSDENIKKNLIKEIIKILGEKKLKEFDQIDIIKNILKQFNDSEKYIFIDICDKNKIKKKKYSDKIKESKRTIIFLGEGIKKKINKCIKEDKIKNIRELIDPKILGDDEKALFTLSHPSMFPPSKKNELVKKIEELLTTLKNDLDIDIPEKIEKTLTNIEILDEDDIINDDNDDNDIDDNIDNVDNTDEDNTDSESEPEDDNVDKNYIFEDNTFKIKSFLINNDDKKSELKAIILSYILENINQNERIEFIKHYITDKQGSSWSILNIFKK